MPVKRRVNKRRAEQPDWLVPFLLTGERPEGNGDAWIFEGRCLPGKPAAPEWLELRDDLLAEWIDEHPGTRPWAWWRWDAPRLGEIPADLRDSVWAKRCLIEHRQIVAGTAELAWEKYNYAPHYEFGIPLLVVTHANDPPVIESEAAYLRRHKLLKRGEAKRLKKSDFEPEALDVDAEEIENWRFLDAYSERNAS